MNTNELGKGLSRLAIILPGSSPDQWPFRKPFSRNTFLYGSATILAELLRHDPSGRDWRIRTAYIEFENNGGAAVSTPTVARDEGLTYFNDLADSLTRDYLRVPVVATKLESSDEELYPGGNELTFFFETVGVEGVHGKEFSSAQQSRVYGAALVASPSDSDESQDVVFSRVYYGASDQFIKASTTQIGLEYRLPLG